MGRGRAARGATLALAAALAAPFAGTARADGYEDTRVAMGARLFRTLLGADLGLDKKARADGALRVVFFYTSDRKRAEELAAAFAKGPAIRGLPVTVAVDKDPTFAAHADGPLAGVFLAQAPEAAVLRAIVQFGIARGVIVYSPFEGHVEKGVLGGLAVEAQVKPYINLSTLDASNITLKDFFLKVTKVYR